MKPEEIGKLLGGYATGTLTEQEREALFQAAMDDQELFNALAAEHALKELLDDPQARAEVLRSLSESKPGLIARIRGWIGRPMSWAVAGGLAAAVFAGFLAIRIRQSAVEPEPVMIAKQEAPAPSVIKDEVREERRAPPPKAVEVEPQRKELPKRQLAQARSEKEAIRAAAPAEAQVADLSGPLPLRYHVQRLASDGSYTEADSPEAIAAGDSIRLAVEPSRAGYLRVTLEKPAEAQVPILSQQVRPGITYATPTVHMEPPAGQVTFRLTLTPEAPEAGFAVRAARSDLGRAKVAEERKEAPVEVIVKYK